MSRAVEGEAQTPCSESGKKQIAVPLLKTINSKLTLRRTLTTDQQLATQPLLQQLKRFDESTEEHHRLTAIKQLSKQMNGSRELELCCDTTKSGEQSQRFGIGSHLPQGSPATVILKDEIHPVIKPQGFGLCQHNRLLATSFRRKGQHLRLASMQDQRSGQTPEFLELRRTAGLPLASSVTFTPMPLAVALLILPLVPCDRMVDRRQQWKQLIRTTILHRSAGEHPDRPESRMSSQSQQRRRARGSQRLSEVSLVDHQKCSRGWKLCRQPGPAHQLKPKVDSFGLPAPVRVEADRCHHHQPQ